MKATIAIRKTKANIEAISAIANGARIHDTKTYRYVGIEGKLLIVKRINKIYLGTTAALDMDNWETAAIIEA